MTAFLAMTALAAVFLAAAFWMAWLVATAPAGWEDRDGFHVIPELPDAGRDGTDLKTIYDAGRQFPDGAGFVAPVRSFHDLRNSPEAQRDHP
jgi:hypothetical protein